MVDDRRPPEAVIAAGFQHLVEGLRDDVREDIAGLRTELGRVEERVTARVDAVDAAQRSTRGLIERFGVEHSQLHEGEAEERRNAHSTFYEFIRAAELDKARRDGALGVIRWAVEMTARHSTRLVGVILAVAALLGVATGSVNVQVGS
jgi:hypothetical protein